jgi:hypothetical protein
LLCGRRSAGYHARVGRVFASVLLAAGLLGGAISACQDDSVYRSGDVPPSILDASFANDGAANAGGGGSANTDGGAD